MPLEVLLVEGDPDLRSTVAEALREEGYSVEEVTGASGLCEMLARHPPRLVLTALGWPGNALQAVLNEARERNLLAQTKVFALSGHQDAAELVVQLGLGGLLRKPIQLEELLASVERVCRS